jgi:tetratricopeptide (TPR) repeat protein
MMRGEMRQAITFQEQAVAIFRESGDSLEAADVLMDLGTALLEDDLDRASAILEEALSLNQKSDFTEGVGDVLSALGEVARMQGHLENARQFYERSLQNTRDAHKPDISRRLVCLGKLTWPRRNMSRLTTDLARRYR